MPTSYYITCSIIIIQVAVVYSYMLWKKQGKSVQLVVARYNEDVNWLMRPPFNKYPVVLYEKGSTSELPCTVPYCMRIVLPNVGRCDHTYLHYIVAHYAHLPDIVIFLPGSAATNPKKLTTALNFFDNMNDIESLYEIDLDVDMTPDLYDFQLDQWIASSQDNQRMNMESKLQPAPIRPFGKWFHHHFSHDRRIPKVWYGGVIITTRERIQRHPVRMYEDLRDELSTHSNPEAGHYMERAWFSLFCD